MGRLPRTARIVPAAALAVVIALLAAMLPAGASAASGTPREDVVSTHRALLATYALLRATVRTWPTEETGLSALDRQLAGECPDVGAGSPQSEADQKLSYEVVGMLWGNAYRTDAAISQRFIQAVQPLSWTDPSLNRRLHGFVQGLREMLALSTPDVCADVRAWSASDYRTVPTDVLAFDSHIEAIDVEVPPTAILSRYVQPADRPLLARVKLLNTKFDELEALTGQRYWIELLGTLGLNQ
jgi:hypothetical protein